MRLIFTVFVISLIATTLRAQSTETISEYFDKDWKTISDPKRASFYRTIEHQDDRIIVRDYYISGKIQMMAECTEVTPKLVFHGKAVWYYESGVVKVESIYHKNEKTGLFKSYYENGEIETMQIHVPGKKGKYIHYFNSNGQELLVDGNGTVPAGSSDQGESYTIVEDSVARATFNIDRVTKDTVFYVTEQMAQYKGGLEGLARYLQATVKYPKQARKTGVQGTVYVAFVIDKNGAVKDQKIIKGLSSECDAVALDAVASMDNWLPAAYKGVPVKCRFVLPIKFKL